MKSTRTLYNAAGAMAATAGLVLAGASTAAAADDYTLPTPKGGDFSQASDLETSVKTLVPKVLNIVLLLAGVLAVFYLIWSGVQYITSGGNADRVKTARSGIINAIIGIVIIMASFFIIRLAVGAGQTVNNLKS